MPGETYLFARYKPGKRLVEKFRGERPQKVASAFERDS